MRINPSLPVSQCWQLHAPTVRSDLPRVPLHRREASSCPGVTSFIQQGSRERLCRCAREDTAPSSDFRRTVLGIWRPFSFGRVSARHHPPCLLVSVACHDGRIQAHARMATAQQCKRKKQPMKQRAKRSAHGAKGHRVHRPQNGLRFLPPTTTTQVVFKASTDHAMVESRI